MIRVNLQEITPLSGGYNEIIKMGAVPREGEAIFLGDTDYTVRSVIWTPEGEHGYDVQVRFR